jgi:hypothetical protein
MRESSGGGKSFIGAVETSLGLAKQRFHSLSLSLSVLRSALTLYFGAAEMNAAANLAHFEI